MQDERFYLPGTFPTFPEGFVEKLKVEMRKPDREIVPITNTVLWQFWAVEKAFDSGIGLFESFPWRKGSAPKPKNQSSPKVLVACTNIEFDLYCPQPRERAVDLKDLTEKGPKIKTIGQVLMGKGIITARFFFVRTIGSFWASFFGQEHFLDVPQSEWDTPKFIISSGNMRNYPVQGGETLGVRPRLEEVAVECEIEILFP